MGEIATWSMIYSKISMGYTTNECPTKLEITGYNSNIIINNNASYGSNECVMIEDISYQAEITYNYYFSVSQGSVTYAPKEDGTTSISITSYKRQVVDGVEDPTNIAVDFTIGPTASWYSATKSSTVTVFVTCTGENQSLSSRSHTLVLTQNESGKTASIVVNQNAGYYTYGIPNVSVVYDNSSSNRIPASGGTLPVSSLTYSQTYGWNGVSSGIGTITTGGTTLYELRDNNLEDYGLGGNVSLNTTNGQLTITSLGTTTTGTFDTVTVGVNVTLNGRTGYDSQIIYIQQNKVQSTTKSYYDIDVSANPSTIASTGGTSTITSNVYYNTIDHYTSGATSNGSSGREDATISISGTGFTLNGNTVTASANPGNDIRTCTVTASKSGYTETATTTITQSAYNVSYNYYFTIDGATVDDISFTAKPTAAITSTVKSYMKTVINGVEQDEEINVDYTWNTPASWYTVTKGVSVTCQENKTASARNHTLTLTQNDSNKTVILNISQVAGTRSYSNVTVTLGTVDDIPASGGTADKPSVTYSQTWGWNGATTGGGTITSGGTVSWSPTSITANSLGTTVKSRSLVGTWTCTVTLNGKSESATRDVYQQANNLETTTYGDTYIALTLSSNRIAAAGGSVTITEHSAYQDYTQHYTSGATNTGKTDKGTPNIQISGDGFSMSGYTITATENTMESQRVCTVTATMSGVTTVQATVTQESAIVQIMLGWSNTDIHEVPAGISVGSSSYIEDTNRAYFKVFVNGSQIYDKNSIKVYVDDSSSEFTTITNLSFNTTSSGVSGQYGRFDMNTTMNLGPVRTSRVWIEHIPSGVKRYVEYIQGENNNVSYMLKVVESDKYTSEITASGYSVKEVYQYDEQGAYFIMQSYVFSLDDTSVRAAMPIKETTDTSQPDWVTGDPIISVENPEDFTYRVTIPTNEPSESRLCTFYIQQENIAGSSCEVDLTQLPAPILNFTINISLALPLSVLQLTVRDSDGSIIQEYGPDWQINFDMQVKYKPITMYLEIPKTEADQFILMRMEDIRLSKTEYGDDITPQFGIEYELTDGHEGSFVVDNRLRSWNPSWIDTYGQLSNDSANNYVGFSGMCFYPNYPYLDSETNFSWQFPGFLGVPTINLVVLFN